MGALIHIVVSMKLCVLGVAIELHTVLRVGRRRP